MSSNIKQFAPPVKNANSANGYSLAYALSHPRKIPHRLPSGWRWLEIGEYPQAEDVCCDPRIAPVQILLPGPAITDTHHPVRTKRPKRASHPLQDKPPALRPIRKPMTIALGFNCLDGMVLCTDSMDSDGFTKSKVDKIWCYETQDDWGIAVANAGESDFIDSFTDNLKELFAGEQFDRDWIMATLRQAINAARTSYPDLQWAALFALFGPNLFDRKLLRVSANSKHIAPVTRYEAIGAGNQLAKFLCSKMYTQVMSVDEAAELAVFIVLQCINHVDGCELPISLLTWKVGLKTWGFNPQEDVQKIIQKVNAVDLRENLLAYWREKTPHLTRRLKHDRLPEGGSVKFIRAIATKPKRSTSQ